MQDAHETKSLVKYQSLLPQIELRLSRVNSEVPDCVLSGLGLHCFPRYH